MSCKTGEEGQAVKCPLGCTGLILKGKECTDWTKTGR